MKILATLCLLILSSSSPAAVQKLNFSAPELKVKSVVMKRPIQTNLIRLYMRLPSEKRMIAGYKETKLTPTNSI